MGICSVFLYGNTAYLYNHRFGVLAVLITTWILSLGVDGQIHRGCSFTESWRGKWYQSGLGEITITENHMNKKGRCVQHYSDYYILEDEEKDCVMCLLMLERHDNIIQYKESYCVRNKNIQTICSLIQVEGIMYTLVKETTDGIKCPFNGNFLNDYRDYTHNYCDSATESTVQTCSGTNMLYFHFNHCEDTAMWNNADVELECIAIWKEGSDDFLYGRFSGSVISSKHDSYRCFKYEKRGAEIYLSMSADATCRGLITAEVGPITMKITKRVTLYEENCLYPDWLFSNGRTWLDLAGDHTLIAAGDSLTLRDSHSRRDISELTCHDISHVTLGGSRGNYFVSGYFHMNQCSKNYNCLHIVELHKSVFIFYVGVIYPSAVSAQQCEENISEKSKQHIFIDSALETKVDECPFKGVYNIISGHNSCDMTIQVGCHGENTLKFQSGCGNITSSEMSFTCRRTWKDGESTIALLTDFQENIVCLNIKEKPKGLKLKRCKHSPDFYPYLQLPSHLFLTKRDTCQSKQITTTTLPHRSHTKDHHHKTLTIPTPRPTRNIGHTTKATTVIPSSSTNTRQTITLAIEEAKTTKDLYEDKHLYNKIRRKTTEANERVTVTNNVDYLLTNSGESTTCLSFQRNKLIWLLVISHLAFGLRYT